MHIVVLIGKATIRRVFYNFFEKDSDTEKTVTAVSDARSIIQFKSDSEHISIYPNASNPEPPLSNSLGPNSSRE